ncbi:hypothetical protein [Halospeciosus flavus]
MRAKYPAVIAETLSNAARFRWGAGTTLAMVTFLLVVASEPVLAQSVGSTFCNTELAQTVKNIFSIIQFGGPLIGGVVALGATVATPAVRRADKKQEMKEMRNQAIIWGIIVAPLATVILTFLLNNVVVGGTSCGF